MVIDADQKLIFQSLKPGAMDAVTFQYDGGFIPAGHTVCLHNLIGKRQGAINAGDSVVQNDIRLLAHFAQNLAAGERRSDGIAIGTRVRREHESFALSDLS